VIISGILGAVVGMRLRVKGQTGRKKGKRSKPLSKRSAYSLPSSRHR
jgi:hypothetical protein